MAMRIWLLLVLVLAFGAGGAGGAAAQDDRVTAALSHGRVYVGDEVVYQVVLRGVRAASPPEVEFPASVRAREAGTSESSRESIQIVNGRATRVRDATVTYQHRVTALRPGTVEIPPAQVRLADGSVVWTEAVRLEVMLPALASGFELDVELDRTTLYLGETVTARVSWSIPERIANFDFDTSVFDPRLTVEIAPPEPGTRELNEFRFLGRRAFGVLEEGFDARGREVIRFVFRVRITPTEAGRLTLGPMRVVFDREAVGWGRDRERVYAESDPLVLDVRPLPQDGRPDGFTGLIGRYELRTLASPTTVNVGDPITLKAELAGDEPMVGADDLPGLETMPGFDRFRIASDGWREEEPRRPDRRLFTTTIRALSDEVTSVPPVRLHAFDPARGAYVVVESDPIQLDVRAVREATLADAVMSPGAGAPGRGTRAETIGPADAAFWAAPTPAAVRDARPFRFDEAIRHPAAIGALVGGPVSVAAAGAFVLVARRRATPGVAARRALRQAEHLVLRAGPGAAARAACAAVLDCEPRAVTGADAERLPTDAATVATLRAALEADESEGAQGPPAEEVRRAIRSLRRAAGRGEVA